MGASLVLAGGVTVLLGKAPGFGEALWVLPTLAAAALMGWTAFDDGRSLGAEGSEGGTIRRDEEHDLGALRHARALTQEALAKASGLPRSTIANLESGTGNPSLSVLVKVARALGVPIDELLAGPRAKVRRWTEEDMPRESRGPRVLSRNPRTESGPPTNQWRLGGRDSVLP